MNVRFWSLMMVCGVAAGVRAQGLAVPMPARLAPAEDAPPAVAAVGEPMPAAPELAPAAPVSGTATTRVTAVRRDPFWPVGFVPKRTDKALPAAGKGSPTAGNPGGTASQPAPKAVDWEEALRHLDIRGISRVARDRTSGREAYFAVVNGRIVEEGDTVASSWEGRVYRWRVGQITPNGVQLSKLDSRVD